MGLGGLRWSLKGEEVLHRNCGCAAAAGGYAAAAFAAKQPSSSSDRHAMLANSPDFSTASSADLDSTRWARPA